MTTTLPMRAQLLSNLHAFCYCVSLNYEVCITFANKHRVILILIVFDLCVCVSQATRRSADQCVCAEKTPDTHRVQNWRGRCCDNSEWRVCDCPWKQRGCGSHTIHTTGRYNVQRRDNDKSTFCLKLRFVMYLYCWYILVQLKIQIVVSPNKHSYHQTVMMLNKVFCTVYRVYFYFEDTLSHQYRVVLLVLFISCIAPCFFVPAAQVLLWPSFWGGELQRGGVSKNSISSGAAHAQWVG